ncbi:MAG: metallophosphoesterase [Gammaproteobacteria bacterium]
MPHVSSFSNNQNGKDYIIGDVHGNGDLLELVLQTIDLKANDRLFIAGDLFDRGPQPVNESRDVAI